MSSDLHQQAEVIFNEAIERPTSARELYLDDVCRADPELREEVESLIAHYETAEGMLLPPWYRRLDEDDEAPFRTRTRS